jgi:hypothetical protein
MQEITHLMNRYREAARVLWNNFFLEPEVDFDTVEAFDVTRGRLFETLVLRHVVATGDRSVEGLEPSRFILEPLRAFDLIRVVPVADRVPIHVNRAGPESGYWDAEPTAISQSEADLLYVDCFDWDVRGYREFHYYRLEVRNFKGRPDLEGRPALLSVEHCRVFVAAAEHSTTAESSG